MVSKPTLPHLAELCNHLILEGMKHADGTTVNFHTHERAMSSTRSFEMNFRGQPCKVTVIVEQADG